MNTPKKPLTIEAVLAEMNWRIPARKPETAAQRSADMAERERDVADLEAWMPEEERGEE